MRIITWVLLLIFTAGCTTVKTPEPVSIVSPAEGNASIYIFRSELDKVRKSDSPNLFINDILVCKIPYSSYTRVELPAGKHSIKLIANEAESQIWNSEAIIEVTKKEIYFISIWNSNQPREVIANVPIAIPGLIALWPILGPKNGAKPGASFEAVDRTTGEYSLAGLRYIPPN